MVNSSVRHYASSGSSHVHLNLDSVGVLCVIGCGHIGRCDGVDDVKGEGGNHLGSSAWSSVLVWDALRDPQRGRARLRAASVSVSALLGAAD